LALQMACTNYEANLIGQAALLLAIGMSFYLFARRRPA